MVDYFTAFKDWYKLEKFRVFAKTNLTIQITSNRVNFIDDIDASRIPEEHKFEQENLNLRERLIPQDDEYVMPDVDPAQALQAEILRNKKAKERLRMFEKQAAIEKAKANNPLQQYYNQRNLLKPKPRANSNGKELVFKGHLNRTNRTNA